MPKKPKPPTRAEAWQIAVFAMQGDKFLTEAFESAFGDWCENREAMGWPVTALAIRRAIKSLEEIFDHDGAVQRIEQAVTSGWRGLVFPEDRARHKKQAREYAQRDRSLPKL